MKKYSKSQLRSVPAIDITHYSSERLKTVPRLTQIGHTMSSMGCSGRLFVDESGKHYVILERTMALFAI